ncbi:MAG: hypothetical protein IKK13_06360 [Clostridia bacterium]|nr:hypothetical protein [Clostridia bacterium]
MGFSNKSRHSKNRKNSVQELKTEALEYKIKTKGSTAPAHALTVDEVLGEKRAEPQKIEMSGAKRTVSPLDALRNKVNSSAVAQPAKPADQNTVSVTVKPSYTAAPEQNFSEDTSLLERCIPYITDGGNTVPEQKPAYSLESVESIININESFAQIIDKLDINRENVTFDGLSAESEKIKQVAAAATNSEPEKIEIFEIPMKREENELTTISDIDADDGFTKTVAFTAVKSKDDFEDISSGTRIIDLSSQMFDEEPESKKIENLEAFDAEDEIIVEDDYKSPADTKRVAKKLVVARRNSFVRSFLSILITALLALTLIPELQLALLATPKAFYITVTVAFLVITLVNFDMLLSLKTLFTPRKKVGALAAVAAGPLLVYGVAAIIGGSNPFDLIFAGSIMLSCRAVAQFMQDNRILSNFRTIAKKREKSVIKFIDDKPSTFAMARNSIDGDVLIATTAKADNVQDFLKNTLSDSPFLGAVGKFLVAALCFSTVAAVLAAIKSASVLQFFEFFASCMLVLFAPSLMFTDALPLARYAKRLHRVGAMLTGTYAANKLDMANALTLSSSQLFPDGTLTLHNIKILDENAIDATLIDAAAITNAIGSPLKGVFNAIAKTTPTEIPTADSIKYEEKLGISGWINDRRIFIGTSTLLTAHGIQTPSVEVDHKILRQGYFPVYLACDGKPCALLSVKYNVKRDIAYRLQKLSDSGITFLVDNCDPNLSDNMIADYFGLNAESVRVMGGLGSQLNSEAAEYKENVSSVAVHRGTAVSLIELFIAAGGIRHSVKRLALFHILTSSAFLLYLSYSTIVGVILPLGSLTVLLGNLTLLVISFIISRFD